jgi:hypothetical protein
MRFWIVLDFANDLIIKQGLSPYQLNIYKPILSPRSVCLEIEQYIRYFTSCEIDRSGPFERQSSDQDATGQLCPGQILIASL